MIGMLLGRVAFNAVRALPPAKGVAPKDVKPTKVGPFVMVALLGLSAFILATSWNGINPAITPVALLMGILVVGGVLWQGAKDAKVKVAKIKEIPGNPNAVPSAAELNAYYETLRPKEPAITVEEVKRELTSQPVRPRPVFKSLNMILAEAEADERFRRVKDIMTAECPVCTADHGTFCTFQSGQRVTRLDEHRIVHSERISYALKMHIAKLSDVKAQFSGRIPEDIIAGAL